jgi:hypothetical protein
VCGSQTKFYMYHMSQWCKGRKNRVGLACCHPQPDPVGLRQIPVIFCRNEPSPGQRTEIGTRLPINPVATVARARAGAACSSCVVTRHHVALMHQRCCLGLVWLLGSNPSVDLIHAGVWVIPSHHRNPQLISSPLPYTFWLVRFNLSYTTQLDL